MPVGFTGDHLIAELLTFGKILFFHQKYPSNWNTVSTGYVPVVASRWPVFNVHLYQQAVFSLPTNPGITTFNTVSHETAGTFPPSLRLPEQLFLGHPLLPAVREEECVLLRLNLRRIGQAVSPVPAKLLRLLGLVLLVTWLREGALLQGKRSRQDELSWRAPMEQSRSL